MAGSDPLDPRLREDRQRAVLDVVIVGAGFSGIYMLYRARAAGLTARVYERGADVGGTWYWNRYPGARCDVESVDYSYSFSPELEQEWVWSERYAAQPEILSYARHVAERFDLRKDITFGADVQKADWDEDALFWTLTLADGSAVTARFCVFAVGALSDPKNPEIPGIDRFGGRIMHTGLWPHEPVSFTKQRVGVIGTGSSGIQCIPIVATQADELVAFQRTPNYTSPARNRPLPAEELVGVKAEYRQRRAKQRSSSGGLPHDPPTQSALQMAPEERNAYLQSQWDNSRLLSLRSAFADVLTDIRANELVASFAASKIRETVRDERVADALTPKTYPYGTKRPCLDTGYYETYNRDNVELIDLRADPIVEITEKGVRTQQRDLMLDTIIFATGFDSLTGPLTRIDVRGVDGMSLRSEWEDGPRTYLGLAVRGFPNLFIVTGPQSPSVLSNMLISIEQHVEWIGNFLECAKSNGVQRCEATADAEGAWVQHCADVASGTLYPRAESSYTGANVAGKPRVFLPYVGGVGVYRRLCSAVAKCGYAGFHLAPPTGRQPALDLEELYKQAVRC